MRRIGFVLLALALAACDDDNGGNPAGPSTTGPIIFSTQLLASNEVPPVTNAEAGARGTVTITMAVPRDSAGNPTGAGTVTFAMQIGSFPPGTVAVGAHIHPGAAGVNGPVIVNTGISPTAPLVMADGSGNLVISNIAITQALASQIVANPAGYYFNVHTPLNPGGAIRGQLARTP
jgi:hypothetical protein